jgi:hypothetical protein
MYEQFVQERLAMAAAGSLEAAGATITGRPMLPLDGCHQACCLPCAFRHAGWHAFIKDPWHGC